MNSNIDGRTLLSPVFINYNFTYILNNILFPHPKSTWMEQIEIIQTKHNISIESYDTAIRTLKSYSYYTLVNGYQMVLETYPNSEIFIEGITIEQLGRIQSIESNISALLLHQIIVVEKYFKTLFQYQITLAFGEKHNEYLNPRKYSTTAKEDRLNIIKKLKLTVNSDKRVSSSLKKYRKEGNVPPWILVNDITFGRFREWYAISPFEVKKGLMEELNINMTKSSKENEFYQEIEFFSISMKYLLDFRNGLAHGDIINKIYPRVDNNINHLNKFYGPNVISDSEYNNGLGRKDIYGLLLILGIFLPSQEIVIFRELLESYLQLLEKEFLPLSDSRTRRILGGLPSNIMDKLNLIFGKQNYKFSSNEFEEDFDGAH
ncbi:Abi family protein [Fructobacillus ficulneus]|uniref:Abi-like protein n=1 Tax=Fructobacillus ficulneus TaxID=157463 RepID=A0A0K8MHE6_9LACO|nr:Abi family protein [Fructobacillus ficulneus]GAO99902.1 hypothetical protein FFIC_260160 [Fructobacillus ficulneus]